jgi:hypothetical protein
MQVQDVEHYLALLDQALVDQGVQTTVPVILLGGAYILITINSRRMTQDIDIFALIGGETDQATGVPLAVALYQAAQVVAQNQQLNPHWLNTIRAAALQPPGIPAQRLLWKQYTLLHVYLPEQTYVLVQKLCINRRKDRQDILALFQSLGIETRGQAQEIVDRYVPQEEQHQQHIPTILHSYFP